jgi:hypothetical protein
VCTYEGFTIRSRKPDHSGLTNVSKQANSSQPDKNLATEERPVPSQAEGDRETVEQDLNEKSQTGTGQPDKR